MTRFERWAVWWTTAATLLTGLAYWWVKEMMTSAEPWAVINHPIQPWLLKAHILVAPLLVFAVGSVTVRHIWLHFRRGVRKGRRTGLVAAVTLIPMIATGYLLQVSSAELLIRILAWSHLALGIAYSVGMGAHWPATRSPRKRPEPRSGAEPPSRMPDWKGERQPAHERRRRRSGHGRAPAGGRGAGERL